MAKPKAKIIRRPAEKISGNLKRNAYSSMIESLALIILGILFVVCPDTIIKVLAYIIGAFFIIKGVYNVIAAYMAGNQKRGFDDNLLSGAIFILIGIASFIIGENIASVFRVIIGIIIIYESLVRISTATKLHAAGIDKWRYVLVISLIMMVLGIFITFSSGAVVTLIGWIMIAAGIIAIIGDTMFIKQVDKVMETLTKGKK